MKNQIKPYFSSARRGLLCGLALASFLCAPVQAIAAGKVTLSNDVFQETTVVNDKGVSEKRRQPVSVITPGTAVTVVITYANQGDAPAENVEIKNPVSKELAFSGEARGANARADYSVDGGASFGELAALTVTTDTGAKRSARAADVNALRFRLQGPVKPGQSGTVEFHALVR